MKNQSEKIQSYQEELSQLEKMYHTVTDQIGEHFDNSEIVSAIQKQIILLTGQISLLKEEQEIYEHEMAFEASQEFDKYYND